MFDKVFQHIQKYIHFSEEEFNAVIPHIRQVQLKRNDFFVKQGQICRHIAFTNKGYMRLYYLHDGVEITRDINMEGTFVAALPSYIKEEPSVEIIQAVTDCEIFTIPKVKLEQLYDQYPRWERLGRRIIEDMFVQNQSRLHMYLTQSAEARYHFLIEEYPEIILNIPLQYIASYLGITSQSLSRIRRKMG